jgi:hypothetical protein
VFRGKKSTETIAVVSVLAHLFVGGGQPFQALPDSAAFGL